MRRRWTTKLMLTLVSLVPHFVSFVVDHAPQPTSAQTRPANAACPIGELRWQTPASPSFLFDPGNSPTLC
jgi:hypothetical protein